MRAIGKQNINYTALLVILSHLIFSSCSKKIQPATSTGETEAFRNIPDTGKKITIDLEKSIKYRKTVAGESARTKTDSLVIVAEYIIGTAEKYFGTPYCFGGTTAKCLDCSGLLVKVFAEHGIRLPHSSQAQSKHGTVIKEKEELIKGDLVFFSGSYNTKNRITHSGIYAGDNKFIHSSTSKGVTVTSLDDPYWKNKFAFGTRILESTGM